MFYATTTPSLKTATYEPGRLVLTLLSTPNRSDLASQSEFHRIGRIQGREWDLKPHVQGFLEEASFQNIQATPYPLPIGTWPKDPNLKEIGKFFRVQLVDGAIEGYTLALFTRFGNWKPSEVQVLLAQIRKELNSNKMHLYSQL